jgi:hypothetical protein
MAAVLALASGAALAQDILEQIAHTPTTPIAVGVELQVLAADGKPATEVALFAIPQPLLLKPAPDAETRYADDELRSRAAFAFTRGVRRAVDAAGRTRVAAGGALVYAFAGDQFGSLHVAASVIAGGQPLVVQLAPKIDVELAIVNDAGAPVPGIGVTGRRGVTGVGRRSDANGRVRFGFVAPDDHSVAVEARLLPAWRSPIVITVTATTPSPLRVVLPRYGSVRVHQHGMDAAKWQPRSVCLESPMGAYQLYDNASVVDGEAVIDFVEPGVRLIASAAVLGIDGVFDVAIDPIKPGEARAVEFDFEHTLGWLACRVTNESGKPLPHARLNVVLPTGRAGESSILFPTSSALGLIEFALGPAWQSRGDLLLQQVIETPPGSVPKNPQAVIPTAKLHAGRNDLGDVRLRTPKD